MPISKAQAVPARVRSHMEVNRDFREAVERLLTVNRDNLGKWLAQVADGTLRVLPDGSVIGEGPNPARALELVSKLAEYAAPKLTRAEVNNFNPLAQATIEIQFVNAPSAPAQVQGPQDNGEQIQDVQARLIEQAPPPELVQQVPQPPEKSAPAALKPEKRAFRFPEAQPWETEDGQDEKPAAAIDPIAPQFVDVQQLPQAVPEPVRQSAVNVTAVLARAQQAMFERAQAEKAKRQDKDE